GTTCGPTSAKSVESTRSGRPYRVTGGAAAPKRPSVSGRRNLPPPRRAASRASSARAGWHAHRMAFGDYQNEIYFQGLAGVVPKLPMIFAELEAKAEKA